MHEDIRFMRAALEEAQKAYDEGEIPVGAVIVHGGKIIAAAHNLNRVLKNPLLHAEMIAIEEAAKAIDNERLNYCTMYVSKEPCVMCAGAIVHARIDRLVIAARDNKYGACGTVFSVCGNPTLNHVPTVEFGLLSDVSSNLLSSFFKTLRNEKQTGRHIS